MSSGGPQGVSGNGPTRDAPAWEEQNGVTVSVGVRPDAGAEAGLKQELAAIQARVEATGEPFSRSSRIHYARFVYVPGDTDPEGGSIGASLMYLADFDGSAEKHLDEIASIAGQEFDLLSPFCVDPIPPSLDGRRRWLSDHVIVDATYYVNTMGRTVAQIRGQAHLREAVERFADKEKLAFASPDEARRRILEFVSRQEDLRWVLTPLPEGKSWTIRRTLARVLGIAAAVPTVLVLLPVLVVWALILRWREASDAGDPPRPDPVHVAELASLEDRSLQNQFSALGFVKPGWFRLTTARVILWVGRFGARFFFDREDLAGVKTIHFARWTFIDGRRRMLFASNYDGSLENYMGDFIDIVAWGLNAIFSNGSGYPKTRWLILDGAWNEGAFKRHIRNRQIPTQVWYAAYPNLSAVKIAENARFHAGLLEPPAAERTKDWLWALRQNWGQPAPVPVKLEREDLQGLVVRGHSQHLSACFLLLTLPEGAAGRNGARHWLADLAPRITNGESTRHETDIHVAFSHRGLQRLGCPREILAGFSDEFCAGMTTPHRQRILGDEGANAPDSWDWGGPASPVDGLLLLYAKSNAELAELVQAERSALAAHGIAAKTLETQWIDGGREHFGFQDGLMNPPIEGLGGKRDSGPVVKAGEFILGYQNEYGRYTARPVVSRNLDPSGLLRQDVEQSGGADFGRNGTYLVIRQLRQDVRAFWSFVEAAAAELFGEKERHRRIWLASKMVGRWPGGAPLTLAPETDDPALAGAKDFLYHAHDPRGMGCPIGAHVRRTNPRDSLEPQPGTADSLAVNRRHRLLRRGRSYGPPLAIPPLGGAAIMEAEADADRGLHFICLNANIARQFEFVQASWANNPQFDGLSDDVDPLIGRRGRFAPSGGNGPMSCFTVPASSLPLRVRNLPDFVSVRGGGYFFMPGMSALRYLSQPDGG